MDISQATQKHIAEQEYKERIRQHEKRIEDLIQIYSALYDKASTYTTVVLSVGYAAYFTVWGFMKEQLSRPEMLITAIAISLSVTAFIAWEVYGMIHRSLGLRRMTEISEEKNPESFDKKFSDIQAHMRRENTLHYKHWTIVLVLTIVPALIGALLLMAGFLYRLVSGT